MPEWLIELVQKHLTEAALISIAMFLAGNLVVESLRFSLEKAKVRFQERVQWERTVQERAVQVAEYLALWRGLRPDSLKEDYRRADQLAWELAIWLSPDVYKTLKTAATEPTDEVNALTVIVAVRKFLLGDRAGGLTSEDILVHGPNVGERRR